MKIEKANVKKALFSYLFVAHVIHQLMANYRTPSFRAAVLAGLPGNRLTAGTLLRLAGWCCRPPCSKSSAGSLLSSAAVRTKNELTHSFDTSCSRQEFEIMCSAPSRAHRGVWRSNIGLGVEESCTYKEAVKMKHHVASVFSYVIAGTVYLPGCKAFEQVFANFTT